MNKMLKVQNLTIEDCFENIEQILIRLDHLLIQMMVPWTLTSVDDNVLNENERKDFSEDYLEFQKAYNELIYFCKVLLSKLKEVDFPKNTIPHTTARYSKVLNRRVAETIDLCLELLTCTDAGIPEQDHQMLESSFFAYIMCVKGLNGLIKKYNQTNPLHPMIEIKNIPKDCGIPEEPLVIKEFVQKYDTFEKLAKYCTLNIKGKE